MKQSLLLNNLKLAERCNPDFPTKCSSSARIEVNVVSPIRIQPCTSKSGTPNAALILENNKSVFLHNMYDPHKEARQLIAAQNRVLTMPAHRVCYLVFGLGLGYHVFELIKHIEKPRLIVIVDPLTPLVLYSFTVMDYSNLFLQHTVHLVSGHSVSAGIIKLKKIMFEHQADAIVPISLNAELNMMSWFFNPFLDAAMQHMRALEHLNNSYLKQLWQLKQRYYADTEAIAFEELYTRIQHSEKSLSEYTLLESTLCLFQHLTYYGQRKCAVF